MWKKTFECQHIFRSECVVKSSFTYRKKFSWNVRTTKSFIIVLYVHKFRFLKVNDHIIIVSVVRFFFIFHFFTRCLFFLSFSWLDGNHAFLILYFKLGYFSENYNIVIRISNSSYYKYLLFKRADLIDIRVPYKVFLLLRTSDRFNLKY